MKLNRTNMLNATFGLFLVLLLVAVFVAISNRWFIYSINVTHSLNGTVYVIRKGEQVKKGDYVGFRWKGDQLYSSGATFVKIVSGVPGDNVSLDGRKVYVNGKFIGIAKEKSARGIPLEPIKPTIIKDGEIFVSTPAKDGYDSRYERVGLIKESAILGKAYELF